MKHNLIIFDLDGTLADTSLGIVNCHKHANEMMGNPIYDNEKLLSVIGGPLLLTYKTKFNYNDEDAKRAVKIYRDRYAEIGFTEAELYAGMESTLAELKRRGYKLAVATLKAEKFAIPMLEMLGVAKYFDVIHGVDDNDTHTKKSLVELCISELNETASSSVLVGDSAHDANGAKEAGTGFISATYGFGFKNKSDTDIYNPLFVINTPIELLEYFK